mmetsp:Transcript_9034/g.25219  ORF Transcript_9034/g.25219 Transcript_9034/m.25219 type:complete len:82 (-) Transcript_9034:650-895(-)
MKCLFRLQQILRFTPPTSRAAREELVHMEKFRAKCLPEYLTSVSVRSHTSSSRILCWLRTASPMNDPVSKNGGADVGLAAP